MADILQGRRTDGDLPMGMPTLPVPADYPQWWEQVHTLIVSGGSIVAQRSATGFPDGKSLPDRALTVEEWRIFHNAWKNEFPAHQPVRKDGVFAVRRHRSTCSPERHHFDCLLQLDGKISRSKRDNTVEFDGERLHLPVMDWQKADAGDGAYYTGTVTLVGQTFPVWCWTENRLWHLGNAPDAQMKTAYMLDIGGEFMSKKDRRALAYLTSLGLTLSKRWEEPIYRTYGSVSLTHEEYGQLVEAYQFSRLLIWEVAK